MKNLFFIFSLSIIVFACKNEKQSDAVKTSSKNLTLSSCLYFGSIDKYSISMDIQVMGDKIEGLYCYNNKGISIKLTGEVQGEKIILNGSNERFVGTIDSNVFHGDWFKDSKRFAFKLIPSETAYFSVQNKSFKQENCLNAAENKKHISESTNYWDTLCTSLNLDLFQIKSKNKTLETSINQFILTKVLLLGQYGDEQLSFTTIPQLLNYVKNNDDEYGYEQEINCQFIQCYKNFFSFSISDYSYGFGAAHPQHASQYYNIDLKNRKLITLNTLFNKGYEKQLTKIAKQNFIEQNQDEEYDWLTFWDDQDGMFKFYLSDDFLLTPKGILFSYDPYEIGPYAAGSPEVFIAYKTIKKGLKKDCIIHEFIEE